jgi:hypothetical protein
MKHLLFKAALLVGASFLVVSCEKSQDVEFKKNENYLLNQNEATLNKRVTVRDQAMEMQPFDAVSLKNAQFDASKSYSIKLIAEVTPPQYQGQVLQASHVKIVGSNAFVTYNTKGDTHLGGIELYDISDATNPKIKWQAIFPKADVSSVDYFSGRLVIVGAMSPETPGYALESPAFLEVFSLDPSFGIKNVDSIIDIPSYAGTGVSICSSGIFAVGGSNGGLSVFNLNLEEISYHPIKDARAIDITCSDIYVLQAQPATVNHFVMGDDAAFKSATVIGDDLQFEAKSGIAATQKYIFAALNYGGVTMYNIDGTLKQTIAAPSVPVDGIAENFVSNTVTVNNRLVMIANGQAGIYVGAMVAENDDAISMLGSLSFNGSESVNYVESKDQLIFAATGTGGLKIMTIKENK